MSREAEEQKQNYVFRIVFKDEKSRLRVFVAIVSLPPISSDNYELMS